MKKIVYADRELWIGNHSNLGPFIYDKKNQKELDNKKVRIFLIKSNKTSIFMKDILKKHISKNTDKNTKLLSKIINDYVRVFSKRVAHCYRCQNYLDNINFSICSNCGWIKCKCNACGCEYKGSTYEGRY